MTVGNLFIGGSHDGEVHSVDPEHRFVKMIKGSLPRIADFSGNFASMMETETYIRNEFIDITTDGEVSIFVFVHEGFRGSVMKKLMESYNEKCICSGWKPIATAPKDGTLLLLCIGKNICTGRYDVGSEEWSSDDGPFFDPEFWQPLPNPPEVGK